MVAALRHHMRPRALPALLVAALLCSSLAAVPPPRDTPAGPSFLRGLLRQGVVVLPGPTLPGLPTIPGAATSPPTLQGPVTTAPPTITATSTTGPPPTIPAPAIPVLPGPPVVLPGPPVTTTAAPTTTTTAAGSSTTAAASAPIIPAATPSSSPAATSVILPGAPSSFPLLPGPSAAASPAPSAAGTPQIPLLPASTTVPPIVTGPLTTVASVSNSALDAYCAIPATSVLGCLSSAPTSLSTTLGLAISASITLGNGDFLFSVDASGTPGATITGARFTAQIGGDAAPPAPAFPVGDLPVPTPEVTAVRPIDQVPRAAAGAGAASCCGATIFVRVEGTACSSTGCAGFSAVVSRTLACTACTAGTTRVQMLPGVAVCGSCVAPASEVVRAVTTS